MECISFSVVGGSPRTCSRSVGLGLGLSALRAGSRVAAVTPRIVGLVLRSVAAAASRPSAGVWWRGSRRRVQSWAPRGRGPPLVRVPEGGVWMWRWRRWWGIRSQGVPSCWKRASCPPRRAAQHPPLLRGIVTPPPAPSSLTRLPVVRALFLRAMFLRRTWPRQRPVHGGFGLELARAF